MLTGSKTTVRQAYTDAYIQTHTSIHRVRQSDGRNDKKADKMKDSDKGSLVRGKCSSGLRQEDERLRIWILNTQGISGPCREPAIAQALL